MESSAKHIELKDAPKGGGKALKTIGPSVVWAALAIGGWELGQAGEDSGRFMGVEERISVGIE